MRTSRRPTPAASISNSTPQPRDLGHNASLDGLRGLAVLIVVLFHLCRPWPQGGFLGVDIFFALSGFLITTLLLQEGRRTGQVSLRAFAVRRGLRLYPALAVVVGVSFAYSVLSRPEVMLGRHLQNASAVLLYVANIQQISDSSGWFGGLPHTWSLAIEVHFYLIWAVTVAYAVRTSARPARVLLVVALAAAAVSILWRIHLWQHGAAWLRLYLGTDTRLDGLFLGAAAACWRFNGESAPLTRLGRGGTRASQVVAFVTIFGLISLAPWQRGGFAHWAGFTAAAAATGVLILASVDAPHSLAARTLANPTLAWFGRISYSLYLWHVPVLKALSSEKLEARGVPLVAAEATRIALCVIVAAGSYYLLERTAATIGARLLRRPARPASTQPIGSETS